MYNIIYNHERKAEVGEFRDTMLHETTTIWVFTLKTQKQKINLTVFFVCV